MKIQMETYTMEREDGTVAEYTRGSDNIFADLGFPDAEEMLLKAGLASQIHAEIGKRKWTQAKAARELGICRSDVSLLYHCHIDEFTVDRLFTLLNRLGQRVEVRLDPAPAKGSRMLELVTGGTARKAVSPKSSRPKSVRAAKMAA